MAKAAREDVQRRFGVEPMKLEPRVFYRITDNWLAGIIHGGLAGIAQTIGITQDSIA